MPTPKELLSRYVSQSEMSNFFIDKMGIFNVKSYGVSAGTTVAQTSNIETCIEAASTAGASFIYFPPGEYLTTSLSNSTKVNFLGDNASFSTDGSTYTVGNVFAAGIASINNIVNPNANIDILSGSTDLTIANSTVANSVTIGMTTAMQNLININTSNINNISYSIDDLPAKVSTLDLTWSSTRILTETLTVAGAVKKLKTYTYSTTHLDKDYVLSTINSKVYVDASTVIEKEFTDTYVYTDNNLTQIARTT